MKRKLLVIFFIAIIFSLIIYKNKPNFEKIIYIGEINYLKDLNKKISNRFLYNNITYKELINSIKRNDYIIYKNKRIYLNQLISDSSLIIIGANNIEYNNYCINNRLNKQKYKEKINNDKNELIYLLNKITSTKIDILDNYCINEDNN